MMDVKTPLQKDDDKDNRLLFEQYKILSERRINHNNLLWQSPIMFFTAQAFLYMIALGDGTWWARAVAAFISCVFSVLTDILFENNRAMEITDAEQMENIETNLIKDYRGLGLKIHSVQDRRCYLDGTLVRAKQFDIGKFTKINKIPSYNIWTYGFRFTAVVSGLLFLYDTALGVPETAAIIHQLSSTVKASILFFLSIDTILVFIRKACLPMKKHKKICVGIFVSSIVIFGAQNWILFTLLKSQDADFAAYAICGLLQNLMVFVYCIAILQTAKENRKYKKEHKPIL